MNFIEKPRTPTVKKLEKILLFLSKALKHTEKKTENNREKNLIVFGVPEKSNVQETLFKFFTEMTISDKVT